MIYLFGASGLLGKYTHSVLRNCFTEVIPIYHKEQDLTESLPNLRPSDIVVNCAGINSVSPLQIKYAINLNAKMPHRVAKKCKLIQISTDHVFSGKKGKYKITDKTNPSSIYGITKKMGETDVTIRTSFIGEGGGLLGWLFEQTHKEVIGYKNWYWNGITCLQLAEYISHLIGKNKLDGRIIHLAGKPLSKLELIRQLSEVYNLQLQIKTSKLSATKDYTLEGIELGLDLPSMKAYTLNKY